MKTLPLVLAKLVMAEVVLDAALEVDDDDTTLIEEEDAFDVVTVDKVDEALDDVVVAAVVDAAFDINNRSTLSSRR